LRSCNSYLDNPSQQLILSFHSLSSVNQKLLQRIFFYFFSTSRELDQRKEADEMRHREQLIDQKTSLTDKEKSLDEVEKK
jgi:hypothetical protein